MNALLFLESLDQRMVGPAGVEGYRDEKRIVIVWRNKENYGKVRAIRKFDINQHNFPSILFPFIFYLVIIHLSLNFSFTINFHTLNHSLLWRCILVSDAMPSHHTSSLSTIGHTDQNSSYLPTHISANSRYDVMQNYWIIIYCTRVELGCCEDDLLGHCYCIIYPLVPSIHFL